MNVSCVLVGSAVLLVVHFSGKGKSESCEDSLAPLP